MRTTFIGIVWQDYEVVDGDASICLDPAESPIEADLAAVGRSAFAGWVGYRRFCGAKADGLRVIGIAGGPQNARS